MYELIKYWKAAVLVAALGLTGAGMGACHTVEGMGRDVQAVGGGVEDVADETRPYDRDARRR